MRYKSFKQVKLKRSATSNISKDGELLEPPCFADDPGKLVNHLEKWAGSFS